MAEKQIIACIDCKYFCDNDGMLKKCKHEPAIIIFNDEIYGRVLRKGYEYCHDKNENNKCTHFKSVGVLTKLWRKWWIFYYDYIAC
jgi:hypothetical protein